MENGVKKIIINMKAIGWIEHMGSNKNRSRQTVQKMYIYFLLCL